MTIDFVLVPAIEKQSSHAAVSSSFFFDPTLARRQLAAASASGFGMVVIDDVSGPLANLDIAANVARWNSSLDIALTHWVGVTSPAVAAADIAALDRQAGGRLSLRILAEGMPQGFEGESHAASWRRTDEYLMMVKRLWTNERPIDQEGVFYRLRGALVPDKGPQGVSLPIRMSGRSGTAVQVAARHCTVFELPDSSLADTTALIDRVRSAAARYGRASRISFAGRIHADDGRLADGLSFASALVCAGVTQFMVSGLESAAAMERFDAEVAAPLRASRERHPAWRPGRTATGRILKLV